MYIHIDCYNENNKVMKSNAMLYRMSCNGLSSKNKHYTSIERKVFLEILNNYKHVIELKKSDNVTLKDKELAWNEICNKYNGNTLIAQERTVAQLKKLWTNIKQAQRDALTRENQSYLATGGGPPGDKIDIDPDVANIAPHLMKTALVSFTSNMSDVEINDKRDFIFEMISTDRSIELLETENEDCMHVYNIETLKDPLISTKKDDTISCSGPACKPETNVLEEQSLNILDKEKRKPLRSLKRKMNTIDRDELSNTEEILRIERIKQVMDQEQQLARVKQKHEENISCMKENNFAEIYSLELQHLKEIQSFEINIKRAQLKSLESKK